MALCLSRKAGETLKIGDAVVTFKRIRGNVVRVDIDAPGSVRIVRGELEERKPEGPKAA
jgi:carbon storage regulator CsrA